MTAVKPPLARLDPAADTDAVVVSGAWRVDRIGMRQQAAPVCECLRLRRRLVRSEVRASVFIPGTGPRAHNSPSPRGETGLCDEPAGALVLIGWDVPIESRALSRSEMT